MRQDMIYLCTEDVLYGKRLLQYLTEKSNGKLEFGLLTRRESWEQLDQRNVVLFKETEGDEFPGVFKYQKPASIYEEILKKFQISDIRPTIFHEEKAEEVIVVFTPERGNKGILYCLESGIQSARAKRTIFISLSAIPVLFSKELIIPESCPGSLTDLLLSIESEDFEKTVKENIFSISELDIIFPVQHYKDLLDMKSQDLISLIKQLQRGCGYEVCMIECGEFYEFTLGLLSFAETIIIPRATNFLDKLRRTVMRQYFQMEGKECLERKIQWIEIEELDLSDREALLSVLSDGEEVIFNEYG